MVYMEVIAALALVLLMKYIRLCRKHQRDRRRRKTKCRRQQQANSNVANVVASCVVLHNMW